MAPGTSLVAAIASTLHGQGGQCSEGNAEIQLFWFFSHSEAPRAPGSSETPETLPPRHEPAPGGSGSGCSRSRKQDWSPRLCGAGSALWAPSSSPRFTRSRSTPARLHAWPTCEPELGGSPLGTQIAADVKVVHGIIIKCRIRSFTVLTPPQRENV